MEKGFFRYLGAVCAAIFLLMILTALFAIYGYAKSADPGGGSGTQTGESKELNIDIFPPEIFEYTSIYSMFAYDIGTKYNIVEEGTFSVESSRSRYKNRMSGVITTYNVEYLSTYDEIYEVWLVDLDTGYQLSLGLFTVDQSGSARFRFASDAYINPYDMVVITKEPYPDDDPRPSGDVVLLGYFDTTSLTRSTVSQGSGVTKEQYKQYGEEAEEVYG